MKHLSLLLLLACTDQNGEIVVDSPATDDPSATDQAGPTDDNAGETDSTDAATDADPPVSPWLAGPLAVSTARETLRVDGVTIPIELTIPDGQGPFPVVWLFHGFLLDARWYGDIASHLASHGLAVVAPQLHPADGNPLGKPTVAEDADHAEGLRAALEDAGLADRLDLDRALVGGHSRGAKVAWTMVAGGATPLGLFGLDPVDGTGGPLGGEPRVIPETGSFDFDGPALVVGTGLGPESPFPLSPSCAPEGDNHASFWRATRSGWHLVATDYGHLDVLDAARPGCGLTCIACVDGPRDGGLRSATAAWLVAFSRVALGDAGSGADLERTDLPIEIDAEAR
jgi:chlorophyllase